MNVRLDVDTIDEQLKTLAGLGERLGESWHSSEQWIVSGEAGIGGDVLGQAFRAGYDTDATAVRDAARRIPASITENALMGRQALFDYQTMDAHYARDLRATAE
jgi:hypothetical protein